MTVMLPSVESNLTYVSKTTKGRRGTRVIGGVGFGRNGMRWGVRCQTYPKNDWRNPATITRSRRKNTADSFNISFNTISIVPKKRKKSRYRS
jgi:hypothetical protein